MSLATLSTRATEFLDSVLAQQPSIAVFDCDGTLWSGDSGADFFHWEVRNKLVSEDVLKWIVPRYDDYHAGKVDELTMCGEMVTMHKGIPEKVVRDAASRFFAEVVAGREFAEMLELTRRLAESGCEIWAVSSTSNWVVEEGVKRFGIPASRVLAAEVVIDGEGRVTDKLVRVPTGPLKASAIREVIGRPVDAVFGNSVHDFAMLEISKVPYAINPNPDLEKAASDRGWTIYWPEAIKG